MFLAVAATNAFKGDNTFDSGENGVVTTEADIDAGAEVRTMLTYDNGSGKNVLSTIGFYTETLSIAITTVAARAAALFMSPCRCLLKLD